MPDSFIICVQLPTREGREIISELIPLSGFGRLASTLTPPWDQLTPNCSSVRRRILHLSCFVIVLPGPERTHTQARTMSDDSLAGRVGNWCLEWRSDGGSTPNRSQMISHGSGALPKTWRFWMSRLTSASLWLSVKWRCGGRWFRIQDRHGLVSLLCNSEVAVARASTKNRSDVDGRRWSRIFWLEGRRKDPSLLSFHFSVSNTSYFNETKTKSLTARAYGGGHYQSLCAARQ
jgi:hypothetical protein